LQAFSPAGVNTSKCPIAVIASSTQSLSLGGGNHTFRNGILVPLLTHSAIGSHRSPTSNITADGRLGTF
jgi:hypothetical protein